MTLTTAGAAVWNGPDREHLVVDIDLPAPAPGEVLVRVEMATICGSDLHTIAGDRPTPLPTVLGHEAIGEVVATGGEVAAVDGTRLEPGHRVTWTIGTSCGTCARCRRGLSQKCERVQKYGHERQTGTWRLNGGFATHCHLLAGTGVVILPRDLPAELLTPANCATATVVCAARRTDLGAGDVVVVMGCGMLGLTAIAYARHRGAGTVVACDVSASRRALALEFGAAGACAPGELPQTLRAAAGVDRADLVLELSGNSAAVQDALSVLDVNGRLALVGSVSPAPEIHFEPSAFVRNLSSIVGCHNYRADDLVTAVEFLTQVPDPQLFVDLVPRSHPLADITTAIDEARTSGAPRIALTMP